MPSEFDGSFTDFLESTPGGRFTDWLAACAEPYWSDACSHPFTVAIGDGTMPEEAYARYLIEDYTFVTDLASTRRRACMPSLRGMVLPDLGPARSGKTAPGRVLSRRVD